MRERCACDTSVYSMLKGGEGKGMMKMAWFIVSLVHLQLRAWSFIFCAGIAMVGVHSLLYKDI
jgi:hypothetical protein